MSFSRFLDPKNDYLFKRLFGTEKNKDILIYFINSILNRTGSQVVEDVTYLKSDQNPEYAYKKQSVVDVLCRDQTGTQFIIEMQVAKTPGFEERAQFYAAKAYINQMNAGGKYPDLKEVIFIAITDYVMFPNKATWKSDHVTLDKKTYEQDLKAFSFTFIELPKFKHTIDELTTVDEKWAYFFKHANETTEDELTALLGDDVVLKKAFDESTKYSMNEEEWNSYEAALKHERDARAIEEQKLMDAKSEGLAEGKTAGEKSKAIEIALGMLKDKLPLSTIVKYTGLTEDEINAIK
jgi:predicted transposase/invertase (TIGR01784 family)